MPQPAKRLLITAGPTHEPLDAVRYLANRSSGRVGLALADAAVQAGWSVTLLLGPIPDEAVAQALDPRVAVHRFETAEDLSESLDEHFEACDVLIMAAAVADYRPIRRSAGKLPREADRRSIEVEPTPDLVAACAARCRADQKIIAFALEEPEQLQTRAAEKLKRKAVDMIVANPLTTMGSAAIEPIVMTADGGIETPGAMSKEQFARWLLEKVQASVVEDRDG